MKNLLITSLIFIVLFSSISCDKLFKKDENENPTLNIAFNKTTVSVGSTNLLKAITSDPDDDDSVTVTWTVSAGTLSSTLGDSVTWTAPTDTQTVTITAKATDQNDGGATKSIDVFVGNNNPVISGLDISSNRVLPGNTISINCEAADPENQSVIYSFYSIPVGGTFSHSDPESPTATWTAPADQNPSGYFQSQFYKIVAKVTDPLNYSSEDTMEVLVYSEFGSVWIIDSQKGTLEKRTNNGDLVFISSYQFQKPVAVANNIDESYGCYVADFDASAVIKFDEAGEEISTYSGITNVIDLAVHKDTRTIWALSIGDNSLTAINGYTDQVIKTIYGFNQPRSLTINQSSGELWVAETANNRIIKFKVSDSPSSLPDTINSSNVTIFPASPGSPIFNTPSQISLKNTNGSIVYVADKNDYQIEVFRYSNGAYSRNDPPVNLLPLSPIFVQPVSITNIGWHALIMNSDGSFVLFPENSIQNVLPVTGNYNFDHPKAMIIDNRTSECWVGDNGTNQLVKLTLNPDYTFTTQLKISGYLFIEDLVINN